MDLHNTAKAFASIDDKDLGKSVFLFKLMSNVWTVKLLTGLTNLALKLKLPVDGIIKSTIYRQFCGGESLQESSAVVNKLKNSNIKSILDYSVEAKEKEEDFEQTKNEIVKIIRLAKDNDAIPFTCLKVTGIASHDILEKLNLKVPLSGPDQVKASALMNRLEEISSEAHKNDVPIYIDAEESWIQGAIDELTEEMMKKYNKRKAIVLTTLQMYRHDRIEYLNRLIADALLYKYQLGVKLVRGAYWEKENEWARNMGIRSAVHQDKTSTDNDYNKAVKICLEHLQLVTLCAGTHNEESTMYLVHLMNKNSIPNNHPHVYFSQLYGMSDHISYNLAREDYNVVKYLPYGPVKSVIPYLIRRAEENTAIAGQMGRELYLLSQEKKRRAELKLLAR